MKLSETFQLLQRGLIRSTLGIRYGIARWTYKRAAVSGDIQILRNQWSGRPALIVANGPSLNKTPLDQFAGVHSIGMNKIDLIYPRVSWRPDIVVCANSLVAAQNQDAWVEAGIPVFLSWKARRHVARKNRKFLKYFLALASRDFSLDIADGVGSAATVTYTALQFAYYLGADPVVIVGVDHSFSGAKEGKANVIETRKGEDKDHFDPNYFASGQKWGIPNLGLSEYAYARSRQAFEADGRRVYDATIGGKLDIFEKIDISSAVSLLAGRDNA